MSSESRAPSCVPLLVLWLVLSACSPREAIVIGSKNFTEQVLLGEMAAQQIERKLHLPVERKLNLGGTLLTHEAILKGDIDLYPEYSGTAISVVLKQKPAQGVVETYMQVKQAYFERFRLVWLPPLGFNDTFAMVVRTADSKKLSAPVLSLAAKQPWRLGVGYEFLTRPDGLTRLNQTYSLRWQGTPKSMDLGLLYRALEQKSVDMAAGNSTDAQLTNPNFSVLKDDKGAFPPYTACFVVRSNLLENKPDVRSALSMLQNRISEETMRDLNRRVDIGHQPVEKVVRDFLATQP